MTRGDPTRAAIALVLSAGIWLTTGCASPPSIDDASAAGALMEPVDTPAPASTGSSAPASLPTVNELLMQDRFVAVRVALERSGLVAVIDGLDEFVLLAPTGEAFASSGADIGIEYAQLMNDERLLEAIFRYHIVADLSTNDTWRTLNGSTLLVDGADAATMERVDGVEVLERIPVRNGTVVVMPRLLLPTTT